jgi:exodeoxyribonuclease VII small subunit
MSLETGGAAELTFEQAYTRLEELIQRLDEGGLSLDEALTCYEEASALVARCNSVLDAAELRLRTVAERAGEDEDELEAFGS